jgi:anti-sigma regulatory factor (Ser/Thr protein kinase)
MLSGLGCDALHLGKPDVRATIVDTQQLAHSYPALPDSVPLARQELVDFAVSAGADDDRTEDIRLSVSEALTNVVLHAYQRPADAAGEIHVRADVVDDELWVAISDDGGGLQPQRHSPGLGVGLALIAQTSDGLTIMDRSSGGTEVRMRFVLEPGSYTGDYDRGSSFSATSPATPPFSTTT